MKRLLTLSRTLLATASLLLFASSAFAQAGLNLSWDDCGSAGALQKNFACASNSGANTMVASVIVGTPMNQLNGMASVIDLQTNEPSLSAWWNFGGCRLATNLSGDFSFVTGPFSCTDAWQGSAAGGINYQYQFGAVNRGRIRSVCAIPGSTSIDGTTEYYIYKITFLNQRSTGTGSCAGCADGACIVLNSMLVTQPAPVGDDRTFTDPSTRRHILWQAGGNTIGGLGCPAQVPTRNQTWGSVKSLYR